jgi:hypothetical protein
MQTMQERGAICADRSEIVHTFANGWTVRRLVTCGDLRREGQLMRSCLAQYALDEMDPSVPALVVKKSRLADDDPHGWEERDALEKGHHERFAAYLLSSLYSLRDAHNLPHATWWTRPGMYSTEILGHKNHELKDSYRRMVDEWIQLVKAPHINLTFLQLQMKTSLVQKVIECRRRAPHLAEKANTLETLLIVRADLGHMANCEDDPEAGDLWRAFNEMIDLKMDELTELAGIAEPVAA